MPESAHLPEQERFRTAVENLLDAFMISSAIRDEAGEIVDFCIEYVNEAACALNQRTREQQAGRGLLEIFPNLREVGLFDVYSRVVDKILQSLVADSGQPALIRSTGISYFPHRKEPPMEDEKRARTGVPGLDQIVGGGCPRGLSTS